MDHVVLEQLQNLSNRLVSEVNALANPYQSIDQHPFLETGEGHVTENEAKRNILCSLHEIEALVRGPKDFLENLAVQCEMAGTLQWLGEFQTLACIPLSREVPVKDVANLSNVPEKQLAQIIRFTARCGFLREPRKGHVAHTPLSACFVTRPSHLDAAMFLAQHVAPAALEAAMATQKFRGSRAANETAFNLAAKSKTSFVVAREQNPRLSRQWSAFLHHAVGLPEDHVVADAMAKLNWGNISKAGGQVVEIGAYAASKTLSVLFPRLRFVLQLPRGPSDPSHPSTTEQVVTAIRIPGTPQSVTSAAVYILHPPSPLPSQVLTELQVHLPALRMSGGIMLIMTSRLLPGDGETMRGNRASVAHARSLIMYQMTNEMEMDLSSLMEMIDTVRDSMGKLVLVHKLRSSSGITVALVVKYQLSTESSSY